MVEKHYQLVVYQRAMDVAMRLFEISRDFPREEAYSLTDQMRRSSRSVCANLAEAWRRRIYKASFISKINECEAEAAESQTWITFAYKCQYLDKTTAKELHDEYDEILALLVSMRQRAKEPKIGAFPHPKTNSLLPPPSSLLPTPSPT